MLARFFELRLGQIRSMMSLLGYELSVVVSEHEINLEVEKPGDTEGRAWDPEHFVSGNVFIDGYANPIKPTLSEDMTLELIESDRYQTYMKNNLVSEIVESAGGRSDLSIKQAIVIIASIQIAMTAVLFIL